MATADSEIYRFATTVRQEVLIAAEAEDGELIHAEAFTRLVIEYLTEAAEVEDALSCYHRDHGIEISGYAIDDDDGVVDLISTIYKAEVPPATTSASEVATAFRRLRALWERSEDSYHLGLEESSDAFDMALRLKDARRRTSKVRLFVLTDGIARAVQRPVEIVDDIEYSFHVWDMPRLQRCVMSGQRREPIEIDFVARFGAAIPCLRADTEATDYEAFLAIIPGGVLSGIYGDYGPRLLELNVRSFLQARGKVNQGIRETIQKDPDRFLAYNNGISATASAVELVDLPDGGKGIRVVKDLQIVNGGQTTASIHHAVRKDRSDVSRIRVQAKLTVVDPAELAAVVPLISRYANSQNKVNEADFSANDPFHVRVEELSRTIWAPPRDGTHRQLRWFYERARGQYADALAREGTPARQRAFKEAHPSNQRFTKTDIAKYENTWDQLPHLVSRGAQKNFVEFTYRLKTRSGFEPDATYYEHLVAKAILFKRAERLVQSEQFGGYRANIVAYTLSLLARTTLQRLDLSGIWREQNISGAVARWITQASHEVHTIITDTPGGANVTEYCKREACWKRVADLLVPLPTDLEGQLLKLRSASGLDAPVAEETAVIQSVAAVPGETWFAISNWAKETNNLESWQRGLAFSLGKLATTGRPPSRKQAKQGEIIRAEAARLGFVTRTDES